MTVIIVGRSRRRRKTATDSKRSCEPAVPLVVADLLVESSYCYCLLQLVLFNTSNTEEGAEQDSLSMLLVCVCPSLDKNAGNKRSPKELLRAHDTPPSFSAPVAGLMMHARWAAPTVIFPSTNASVAKDCSWCRTNCARAQYYVIKKSTRRFPFSNDQQERHIFVHCVCHFRWAPSSS
jgi:hypothetical protein